MQKTNINIKYLLICCLAGALTGTSAPGLDLWLLAWVGFIPFFIILMKDSSIKKNIAYSLGFGFFYNLVYLGWLGALHPLHWMGLNTFLSISLSTFVLCFLSLYSSIYILMFGFTSNYILKLKYLKSLLLAFSWILFTDIISQIGIFAFPWSMIQYSQYQNTDLIQISSIIGGTGLGFIIILFNATCADFIFNLTKYKFDLNIKSKVFKYNIVSLAFITLLISLIVIYGRIQLNNKTEGTITTSVTQAAFPVELFRTGKITKEQHFMAYYNLINKSPDGLIILPEGAINSFIKSKNKSFYLNLLKNAALTKDSTIIFGAYDKIENGDTNAIMSLIPGEKDITVYNKRHLVPFGEYTPFRDLLPEPIENLLSISAREDFVPGEEFNTIKTPYGNAGALVCYELIFPAFSRILTKNGATFLINGSNLGWFHNSIISNQFLAMTIFRAVENNRYFIVAINNGNSAIINNKGEIIKKSPVNKKTFVSAKIKPEKSLSFYTKWGF